MIRIARTPLAGALPFVLASILAACGGGGGGGSTNGLPATGSGSGSQTPAPTYGIAGTTLADATVIFTCGCSQQAGMTTSDASGTYAISATATAVPASPSPIYTTVPGRNYLIVAFANHAQAWTMEFLGKSQQANLNLSPTAGDPNANRPDAATAAAALYVFYESDNQQNESFDAWNFVTIAQWAGHLRSGTVSPHEAQFLSDIQAAQSNSQSLYPAIPPWNPDPADGVNLQIRADIDTLHADALADPTLPIPTPCPNGQCTGTPTP